MSIGGKGIATLLALLLWPGLVPAEDDKAAQKKAEQAVAQREKLGEARAAIARNDGRALARLKRELRDYPLLPYMDYWALSRKLPQLPYSEIDAFLAEHDGTALGDWFRVRVLRELGSRGRFQAYLKYYRPEDGSRAALRCYYADALSRHGDKAAAYELVEELWTVSASQAKECDPVFSHWRRDGGLTPEIAWRRHRLAVEAGNLDLASYIATLMQPPQAGFAAQLRAVHSRPRQLLDYAAFTRSEPEYREIVIHGLRRLALEDAEAAEKAWQRFDASYLFEDEQRNSFLRYLAQQFARQGQQRELEQLLAQHEGLAEPRTLEWLIRQALRDMNWKQVEFWIDQLPEEDQAHERWRYWKARSILEQDGNGRADVAQLLYQKAAGERSYYGFLAADTIGQNYSFVDKPAAVTPQQVEQMAQRADMRRAQELHAIGEFYHARREWNYATRDMSVDELLTAGRLANSWGWYHNSIRSVLAAEYLDDLELRFPLAFTDIVEDVAQRVGSKTALDSYLVYAVARQESHFSHDAKSGAGAMGLMQLLPSTAEETARRAGIPYRRSWDLLTPSTNIALGSHYLNALLNRFDNNRFLAAAAYNAGPTRVSRWLAQSEKKLPFDVWIETIPFQETRNYVQNVLSYSVIYAYRRGEKVPLLQEHEARAKL